MQPLSSLNIESELSYAYLHAVASMAGMSCSAGTRHEDNNGIDANLTAWGPFSNGGYLNEVDIKVQLKAQITPPPDDGVSLSYFLKGVSRYDDLRTETVSVARILVVLFLPEDARDWLNHSAESLALRNAPIGRVSGRPRRRGMPRARPSSCPSRRCSRLNHCLNWLHGSLVAITRSIQTYELRDLHCTN